MSKNKKGVATPAGDVATLVLLIGLFILAFILFLPPDDRAAVLNDGSSISGARSNGEPIQGITLLSAKPGELKPFERNLIVKDLAPAALFTKIESQTTNLATRVEVSRNIFTKNSKTYSLPIQNVNDVQNAKLFFFIEEGDGTFYVELNGQTIFEQPLSDLDVPISLPVSALNSNNEIEVGVRGAFFEGYTLRDLNVKIDRTFENTQVARNFELTTKERNNIEKATAYYYLNCITLRERGLMTITLNGRILRSDFVVCDIGEQAIELPLNQLRAGTNTLEFRIDQGDYQLDDLVLELQVGDATYPTYNFEVGDDDYFDIYNSCFNACQDDCFFECRSDNVCFDLCKDDCDIACPRAEAILELRFDGSGDRKRGAITVNEFQINFNTVDQAYIRDISDTLRRGDNAIKIIPQEEFEITDMRIVLAN